jgi:NDP-sugar pyrophosphorylase family protein
MTRALDAVVLCGGRGTRLGALTAETPKPLLPVEGAPFLLRLLRRLYADGCGHVVLAASYRAEQIEAFVEAYRAELPEVTVVTEPAPLGTGGALRLAAERVRSEVFVALNGDSWLAQPIGPVVARHRSSGWPMTVVLVEAGRVVGGARDKARCVVARDGRLLQFATEAMIGSGWINGGLYVIDRATALGWPAGAYSLEQRLLALVPGGPGAFQSEASLLDIGTPACYEAAGRWLERGGTLSMATLQSGWRA